ncbi:hypothetical protein MRB53_038356 [Persea americana]|nr:hypothetical protein MRB53_038356 [Persea americana]
MFTCFRSSSQLHRPCNNALLCMMPAFTLRSLPDFVNDIAARTGESPLTLYCAAVMVALAFFVECYLIKILMKLVGWL